MKTFLLTVVLVLAGVGAGTAADAKLSSPWERTVVTLEVTRKQYDYIQPWSKRVETVQKSALILDGHRLLTTADYLGDHTLTRLQKGGRGKWWAGEVQWVDYHANLAQLTAEDPAFWNGLTPARLADPMPTQGSAQLLRWRNGNLESRKADLNRLTVKNGKLTFVDYVHLELDSEVNGAGWAEALVLGNQVIGITTSQDGNLLTALPALFIRPILEAVDKKNYRGLGYFDFTWQKTENPALVKSLQLTGEPRGAIVIEAAAKPGVPAVLKARDILLQIDGFDVDTSGDYRDPRYGNLSLENLATRQHWAGDDVRMKIWRDGHALDVVYHLPKAEYAAELVPTALFDQEPEYLLVGGLVFQPLTEPYLRSWGADWKRKAPFRLAYYKSEKPTPQRPSRVILAQVLPDAFNLGYQDYRYLALDQVNGRPIGRLADVVEALQQPVNGFHVFEFGRGDAYRRLVLDASQTAEATQRVLDRFGIERDHVFVPAPAGR